MIVSMHNQYRGSTVISVHVRLSTPETLYYFEESTEQYSHQISQREQRQPFSYAPLFVAGRPSLARHSRTHHNNYNQVSIPTSKPNHTEFDSFAVSAVNAPHTVSMDTAHLSLAIGRKRGMLTSQKCWNFQSPKHQKFTVIDDAIKTIAPISTICQQHSNISKTKASEQANMFRFPYPVVGWIVLTVLKGYNRLGKCAINLLEQSSPAHLVLGFMVFAAPFTHATQAITAVKEMNQPATGGTIVSISGSSFVLNSAISSLGDSLCEETLWISETSLKCIAGYGIGGSLPTLVNFLNVSSSSLTQAITYHLALLSTVISKNTLSMEVWRFTIIGGNFGVSSLSLRGRVEQTGTAATDWTAETSLICKAAAGSEMSMKVVVSIGALVASVTEIMSYGANQISSLIRMNQPVKNLEARAVIGGSNFANIRYIVLYSN